MLGVVLACCQCWCIVQVGHKKVVGVTPFFFVSVCLGLTKRIINIKKASELSKVRDTLSLVKLCSRRVYQIKLLYQSILSGINHQLTVTDTAT